MVAISLILGSSRREGSSGLALEQRDGEINTLHHCHSRQPATLALILPLTPGWLVRLLDRSWVMIYLLTLCRRIYIYLLLLETSTSQEAQRPQGRPAASTEAFSLTTNHSLWLFLISNSAPTEAHQGLSGEPRGLYAVTTIPLRWQYSISFS